MSKVFVNIGLSLDGYMAPEGMTMENWDKPEYKNWGAKWGALMAWIINQQYFRENLKLGPGERPARQGHGTGSSPVGRFEHPTLSLCFLK